MSINRFRYFFKVARLGSIREAAAVLHVAPSAISRQIAKLEAELGADLVEANGRGIRLTAAGEILARQASQMVDALEQARSQIDDLLGLRRGHVRVWTVEGSLGDLVLPALASFRERYPSVTHELTVSSSDRIVAALLDNDADLGIVFNPPEHSDLIALGHGVDTLCAVLRRQHPAARMRRIALSELVKYPLALPDQTFGLRHMVDAAANSAAVRLAPFLVTNSIEALRAFVRSGAGVTILPHFAVANDVKRRILCTVPLMERELRQARTTVLARRGRQLQLAVTRFGECLVQAARISSK